jgi:endonuclease/exonuclease/phosphatase family metal-dependent hydrolase
VACALGVDAAHGTEIEVVSLNAWHGLRPQAAWRLAGEPKARRGARLEAQARALEEIAPDLLFLQEVNPAPRRARELAERLGYDEVHKIDACGLRVGAVGIPTNIRSGLAILARRSLGLSRVGAVRLSGPGGCNDAFGYQLGETRHALLAEVEVAGARILLADVHLHHVPCGSLAFTDELSALAHSGDVDRAEADEIAERVARGRARQEREARALVEAIDRHAARTSYAAVIVAGDFNAESGSAVLGTLVRHGFRLAVDPSPGGAPTYDPVANPDSTSLAAAPSAPYPTFDRPALAALYAAARARPRRIDHVLVRGALRMTATDRVLDTAREGLFPSDHFGVRVRLRAP